jgi:hypothetical protein
MAKQVTNIGYDVIKESRSLFVNPFAIFFPCFSGSDLNLVVLAKFCSA